MAAGQPMTAVDLLLDITPDGTDAFVATIGAQQGFPRLFGGHVAAQALLSACTTVEADRLPHSLHSYFVLPGKPGVPIRYEVTRTRDGRSFATRHVVARQGDASIFELLASFHRLESGPDWQMEAPELGAVPPPLDRLPNEHLTHLSDLLDFRPVEEPSFERWGFHPFWFRTRPHVGDDPARNAAMLTFVSDMGLMASARAPGVTAPLAAGASIDHAMWFHRPPRVDEWMLFSTETVANIGARGMARGSIHTADGTLVATVAQEALLRLL